METHNPWLSVLQKTDLFVNSVDDHERNWNDILQQLQTVEKYLKNERYRESVPESFYSSICQILNEGGHQIIDQREECHLIVSVLIECFRCLRNGCANCARNQTQIAAQPGILKETIYIAENLKSKLHIPECAVLLRCVIQFLGNFIVKNHENQQEVLRGLKSLFRDFVSSPDEKLPSYTCMVLHACLSGHKTEDSKLETFLTSEVEGKLLLASILDAFERCHSEWLLFVIQDVLQLNNTWASMKAAFTTKRKLLLLEVASQLLSCDGGSGGQDSKGSINVSLSNLKAIAEDFKQSGGGIIGLTEPSLERIESPEVILKELEVLCLATSDPYLYWTLREDEQLLQTTIGILHKVHSLGKMGNNAFSSVTKPAESDSITNSQHVAGLKRDLIRLTGNMVYRNVTNQNLVRQLDGIPLILDHTSIDERNPFITQWSIFAIRNLCEDNQENKAVIAALKMEGLSDSVSLLNEMGVSAEVCDEKVVVKRLPKS
ncbi:ataxin-10-like isoform X2 [Liolophura sinensis]|uniref:ataxin-10-like isoform X2 n=1 Tax=Liolophura sinensis TaxID=3198878 RepID=UPI0031591CDA